MNSSHISSGASLSFSQYVRVHACLYSRVFSQHRVFVTVITTLLAVAGKSPWASQVALVLIHCKGPCAHHVTNQRFSCLNNKVTIFRVFAAINVIWPSDDNEDVFGDRNGASKLTWSFVISQGVHMQTYRQPPS